MNLSLKELLHHRTLVLGEVNSGKTALTQKILHAFTDAGRAADILLLDLAPDPVKGIGGKITLPFHSDIVYLTAHVVAPRLTGTTDADIDRLARQNATRIEKLFEDTRAALKPILFINDASLYLHAGKPERLFDLIQQTRTVVINAYYGQTFADSAFSRKERRRVEALRLHCDRIIELP